MSKTELPDSSSTGRDWLWLGAFLLLALGVRLYGIDFGLPNEHARPDERHLIGYTLTIGGNRLNPGFFNYPSLYLYILFAAYGLYFAIGRCTGHFSSAQDLVAEYALAPDWLYLIDRCVVAFLGTATVAIVYFIGKRVVGVRMGRIAALLLSLAYLHVRDSHFGTVDVPVAFFATLAIWCILKANDAKTVPSYFLAGLVSGLAVSTKYNAIALLVPLALLNGLSWTAERGGRGRRLALTAVGVGAGFLVGTPFALLDWPRFLRDASFELVQKTHEMPDVDLGIGWLYHLSVTLPLGLGIPMLLAAVAGATVALREKPRIALLLLAFPLMWWLGVGKSHFVFVRYAVPLAPMICVFAAWGVDALVRALERAEAANHPGRTWLARCVLVGVTLALLATPTWRLLQWDGLVRRTDTRLLAASWIGNNVPSGATVGVVGPKYMWPQLWNSPPQLLRSSEVGEGRRLRNELMLKHASLGGVSSYETYVFKHNVWQDTLDEHAPAAGPPSYVIMAEHPIWRPEEGDAPALGSEYEEVTAFDAYSLPTAATFDWQDAFYFPFANFDGVERPGPNLRVFRRVHPTTDRREPPSRSHEAP